MDVDLFEGYPSTVCWQWYQLEAEQPALDILVNDVWGGEYKAEWYTPIREQLREKKTGLLRNAVESHIVTSHFLLRLLIKREGGALFEVAVSRIAFALSEELNPHGCTGIGITPGWLRSEMMLDGFGVTEANRRDAARKRPRREHSQTPCMSASI